jgi:DNA helicase HerA-like ATPase
MATDSPLVLGTATIGMELHAPVTLSGDDRRRHLHIIGKTGTGKSTLLLNLMLQDLAAGRGFALLDPHGDLAAAVIDAVPPERTNHVLYLNPADREFPIAFNPLDSVPLDARALVTAHLVSAFKHIWAESWGPRLEYILMQSIRLLLDAPGTTLLGLPRLLVDEQYRKRLLSTCRDPLVVAFWTRELPSWGSAFTAEALSPVQNKIGALISPPVLRNIIGQPRSTINLPSLMNERRVLIANLSNAAIGEGPAHLLGAFLATSFAQAAQARAAIPEMERVDFILYADEFQNFATDSFALVLSEARKWRLSLTLAHQFLGQLPTGLRQAVMGNAGSLIAFRIGAEDAEAVAAEMGFDSVSALTELANFTAWAKLMRNDYPAGPVHIDTEEPVIDFRGRSHAIIARTRARHARPRAVVEDKITRFTNPI